MCHSDDCQMLPLALLGTYEVLQLGWNYSQKNLSHPTNGLSLHQFQCLHSFNLYFSVFYFIFTLYNQFSQNWAQHFVGDENYYTKRISDGLISIELCVIGGQEVLWPGRGWGAWLRRLYWRLTQCWVMIALQPCELWCRYLFFSSPGLFCLPDLLHSDLWRQQARSKLKSLFSVRQHHWKGANCSSMSCSSQTEWLLHINACIHADAFRHILL